MRKKIAAANWKMNLGATEAQALITDIQALPHALKPHQEAVFAVPAPYLAMAVAAFKGKTGVGIAAQNCSDKASGAYTGEISVGMLTSIGVSHVVLGHSERREYFHEDNAWLAAKTDRVLSAGLTPIFCCGEPLSVREAGTQNDFVAQQLKDSLFHLTAEELLKTVIAYEPIWAIGTGKTASSEQAQEMHAFIRQTLGQQYGAETADQISILYGGSVKAANAVELFSQPDVDGGLVGGASLVATEFVAIINALP
ncbi:MAG: triose-phosphate isomerase [Sphingobacteriia bacterium]|nr:MAG: triose-phosphate isomerase [Sphingobacteriia bacterium]